MTPEIVVELRAAAEVDRNARAELSRVRGDVGYPPGLTPPPLPGPRLAPEATAALALFAAGLMLFGVAKRRRAVGILALPVWVGCAVASWGPQVRDVRVVAEPAVPREGNATSYPAALDIVPTGAEVVVTGERGGWCQIARDGGRAWLPAGVLVR